MHNSPDTPTGTNWQFRSSKYICVLAMGRPIEIGEMGESIFVSVDQIVVSVGPYMFHNSPQRGSSSLANSRDKASPPHSTLSLWSPFQPASISIRQVAGVACMMLGPHAAIRS